MNEDPSKMYEFLEALNLFGSPAHSSGKENGSNKRDKQVDSTSCQESKKCADHCVDCFCVFCTK